MFTPNAENHWRTHTRRKLLGRRANDRAAKRQKEAEEVTSLKNGEYIEQVWKFKYPGRIMDENDDNSRCILAQLSKARSMWWCMSKILKGRGVTLT